MAGTALGFIGTGTITQAIVDGLLADGRTTPAVVVSPRSASRAADLAARYPNVRIAGDNQAVVDAAEMVVLAIRPQVAEAVVRALRFRDGQRVLSLIAAVDGERLATWIDADVPIVRAVPLPFVARRHGVTSIFPPDASTRALFEPLGTVVESPTVEAFELLCAASALMGTYFGILERAVDWLSGQGIAEADARAYLVALFSSLGRTAQDAPQTPLADLRHEFSTRGGLNEQMFSIFEALDGVLARVRRQDRG